MKKILIILLAVLLVGAAAAYLYFGTDLFAPGETTPPVVTQMDLRGQELPDLGELAQQTQLTWLDLRDTGLTAEQYRALADSLPGCEILWSVPFQGRYYPNDTAALTVTQLTEADAALLAYFPNLTQLDASGCEDYALLEQLQEQHPQWDILYQISVAGQALAPTATELTVQDPDLAELEAVLPYLSQLETLTLTGTLPANEEIHKLQVAYPDVCFVWSFELYGVEVSTLDSMIVLSDIPMESTQEVESALPYFHNLERVEMCDCGISNEEMDALGKRHPETRFIWTVSVGWKIRLRTDALYLMPTKYETILDNNDTGNLKYCIDIICIDLGHHDVTDLSFVQYMPHLKYLVVADTAISDISPLAGLQELEYLELFVTNVRDYSPLIQCPNLKDLNICYAAPRDASALVQLTSLENLYIKTGGIPYYIEELQQALPNTNIVYDSSKDSHSTGDGWRKLPRYYEMRDILGMHYMD